MITMAIMVWSAKMGIRVDGMVVPIVADLILAWILTNGLVKIFGGA